MNYKKLKWKRFLSSLLMLAMLATLFPVSAFAIEYQKGTYLSPHNFAIDDSGNLTDTLTLPEGFDDDVLNDRTGSNWSLPEGLNVDLWVYSDDMAEDEISKGTAPYVKDVMGRTWKLSKICITNKSTPTEGQTLIELLDTSSVTSKSDYVVNLSNIELEPRSLANRFYYYDIYYLWELTEGDPAPTQYQVTYDLNLPSELSNDKTLFPVYRVDDRENMDVLSEDGQLYVVKDAVEALSGSVYENVLFTVADFSNTLYVDFLVFDENSYYDFDGWYIEGNEDTLYQTGDVLTAGDSLAGDDNTISFKAKWTEITPLEIDEGTKWEELGELAARPPILSADIRNVADNVLITQWTDTDANLSGNLKSGETVMLDEDRTIYYQMSATVNSALYSSYFSPTFRPSENFMTFTLSLDVDDDLEFVADDNGQATLTFNSPIFKVTETNIENANFSEYPDKNGDSTITFDPDNIPDGNVITVTVKWNEKVENSITAPSGTITLSGFAFKLKDDAANEDMKISTSGNITGSLDLKKPNGINKRYYYQTVLNLLNSNFYGYQEEFGGDASNPTAYVHAMQFTDLVTSDYDLSQDTKAVLNDNTVTATVVQSGSIVIKPADMTVYEGGAGYEGVVDEDGKEIEEIVSSGFPEPLFKIAMPEGSTDAPERLTFANNTTNNSWTVQKAGTDSDETTYYRLVNTKDSGTPIRVQFFGDNNQVIESDTVTTTEEVYDTHTIAIFSNENDVVTASAGETTYNVSAGTGNLTVRAVANSGDATSDVAVDAPTNEVDSGTAMAVAPQGTTYTLNDTDVLLTGAKPSLLFDSIIENEGSTERTDALKARITTALGTDTNVYEIKYLDLVDANNGNAWIKASEPVDIYWGYPAGTDQNSKFTVVHFKDLHRDGEQSGYDTADIASCEVEPIQAESTPQGIKFSVQPGQFSPFALIAAQDYTITATAGNGGSISPSGAVTVNAGADQTFAITPNSGYSIADVKVDGTSVGDVNSYTFEDVAANHTINATFTYNGGGTITPDPDPDPEPTPDPDEPGIADPDDTGVADWLNTKDHEVFLNGYPDGSFGPDRSMTRAEVAAMFSNLLLDKNVPITTSFSDVAEDAWYADAVNMLASLDMIVGYEDGTFRPDAPITRAEFTAIAMRFADAVPEGENIFSDVHAGDWFYDVVVGSIQYGWIGGYEDGTFRPQNTITRAEVTAITNRMLGRVADEAFIDAADELRSFSDLSDAHWAYYSIMEATNAHDYTTSDGVEEWEALH